jgi:NCAIR mutase (PurE)-related protein
VDDQTLRQLLEDVSAGRCTPDEAARQLRRLPFVDLGFARIDHHRALRQGMPESIYGPGKTAQQCATIVLELLAEPTGPVILTRASDEQVKASVVAAEEAGLDGPVITDSQTHSTVAWRSMEPRATQIGVVTAGTADLPAAYECQAVLNALGFGVRLFADCGVAGLHRLLSVIDEIQDVDGVVVVAGMEGALASVVGGLVSAPIIAVPTSAGYGAGLDGVTALLAMLSSCAAGVSVVGIDNGFGAACAMARMFT